MENITEAKSRLEVEDPRQQSGQIIGEAKNIYLISSEEPEAITSTLALFYTLKELNKNVNLIIDTLPENLKFLAPSLDFISYPKNFVISIPNNVAQISQIYYEKNNDALKIHLTLESGNIKKDNASFYFSEAKPDLIITIGVKDYSKELSNRLNSFGFLLDSPILNIDSSPLAEGERVDNEVLMPISSASGIPDDFVIGTRNKKFGKINLLEDSSLTEIIFNLTENIHPVKSADEVGGVADPKGAPAKQFNEASKKSANCLLSGLVFYTENFKNKLTAGIFQTASDLMKKGADLQKITNNIYKPL